MVKRELEGKFGWAEGDHRFFDDCWDFGNSHYPFDSEEEAETNALATTHEPVSIFRLEWKRISPIDCAPCGESLFELMKETFEDKHHGLEAINELDIDADIYGLEAIVQDWIQENVKTSSRMMANFIRVVQNGWA